jgi:hypothetical protein
MKPQVEGAGPGLGNLPMSMQITWLLSLFLFDDKNNPASLLTVIMQ